MGPWEIFPPPQGQFPRSKRFCQQDMWVVKIQTLCHMTQVLLELRFTTVERLTVY